MNDTLNSTTQSEVEYLKRRLAREKKARETAELLLDDYAKKTFLANEMLRKAVDEATRKQKEVEFFVQSTLECNENNSKFALIDTLLKLCVEFSHAVCGTCYFSKNGQLQQDCIQYGESPCEDIRHVLEEHLPIHDSSEFDAWSVQSIDDEPGRMPLWIVSSTVQYSQDTTGWITLFIKEPLISEHVLYILDSHLRQLRTSLHRLDLKEISGSDNQSLSILTKELESTRKQLISADRMTSLGFLASGVAHEINNPLAYIVSNTRYLKRTVHSFFDKIRDALHNTDHDARTPANEKLNLSKVEQDINDILEENLHGLNRLSSISDNLRTFVYTGAESHYYVDINLCVTRAVKMATMSKEASNKLHVALSELQPVAMGNDQEVEQVLLNVIINAMQAISADGRIDILTATAHENVIITIKDDGPGISQQNLAKIFSPFFTTKPIGQGTGLGLAISKNIIMAHGGELLVDSIENVGTTVTIKLPLSQHSEMETR